MPKRKLTGLSTECTAAVMGTGKWLVTIPYELIGGNEFDRRGGNYHARHRASRREMQKIAELLWLATRISGVTIPKATARRMVTIRQFRHSLLDEGDNWGSSHKLLYDVIKSEAFGWIIDDDARHVMQGEHAQFVDRLNRRTELIIQELDHGQR